MSMHGESAFGVLYLPVPVIDIMLKAGIARMHSEINGTGYYSAYCLPREECPLFIITSPFRLQHTNTGPAFGAGAQYKFGPLAARAEYERVSAAGEHPSLFSLGLTWSF